MPRRLVASVVLVVTLAGCLGTDDSQRDPSLEQPRRGAGPIHLSLAACDFFRLSIDADSAAIRPLVPADFELAAPPPGTTPGKLPIVLTGASCTEATILDTNAPASFAGIIVAVIPNDDALRGEGVTRYGYHLAHWLAPDAYAQANDDVGHPYTRANLTVTIGRESATVLIESTSGTVNIDARVSPLTPPLSTTPYESDQHIRIFGEAEGGYSSFEANLTYGPQAGRAPASFSATTNEATSLFGTSGTGVLFHAPGVSFSGATLTFLPLTQRAA